MGWIFYQKGNYINALSQLEESLKSKIVVVMLTTSENPEDVEKAKRRNMVSTFNIKPLTQDTLIKIIEENF